MGLKLIGISGKAGAGKDALAKYIKHVGPELGLGNVEIIGFADPVRYILIEFFGCNPDCVYGDDAAKQTSIPHSLGISIREAAQRIADAFLAIDPLFTLRVAERKLLPHVSQTYVFNDVRRLCEVEWIQSKGGRVIRLNHSAERPRKPSDKHHTETSLDGFGGFDAVFDNREWSPERTASEACLKLHAWQFLNLQGMA
jgi:hypothetical protein